MTTCQSGIGVNTGEVVANSDRGWGDYLVTGDAVNVAARLQQGAEPWQVLVSARTASAASGAYEFGPPRDLALQGHRTGPIAARTVIGRSSTATAQRTPRRSGRRA